jgi:hypothetical protein
LREEESLSVILPFQFSLALVGIIGFSTNASFCIDCCTYRTGIPGTVVIRLERDATQRKSDAVQNELPALRSLE